MLDLLVSASLALLLGASCAFLIFAMAFGGAWLVQAVIDTRRREADSWERHYRGPWR